MTDRSLPHIEAFTGLKMFAGKQEEAQNYLREGKAEGKVINDREAGPIVGHLSLGN